MRAGDALRLARLAVVLPQSLWCQGGGPGRTVALLQDSGWSPRQYGRWRFPRR